MKNKREEVSASEDSDNHTTGNGIMNNSRQKNYIDSSDEDVARSPQKSTKSNPIKEYKRQNPDCTTYSLEDTVDQENEDVYLLEIPKAIDVSWLKGKPINFDDIIKMKLFKKKHIIESINSNPREVILQTRKLRSVTVQKTFRVREYIKNKRSIENSLDGSAFKSTLPEDLKIRHPLFGADYESKLVLDESVVAKLDDLLNQTNSKKKKKKKDKKTKPTLEESVEDVNESIFGLLESHSKKKRTKDVVELPLEAELVAKSKKQKKEDVVLPISTKKEQKRTIDEIELPLEAELITKSKKQKKEDVVLSISTKKEQRMKDEVELPLETELVTKSKKHKKESVVLPISKKNEQKQTKDETELPLDTEMVTKSKKNKKKDAVLSIATESILSLNESPTKEKPKKKTPKKRPMQIKIEPPSPPPYRNKREKTPTIANSTLLNLQLPLFDTDLSQIERIPTPSAEKVKKVKKERRFSQNFSEFEDYPQGKIRTKKEKMSDSQSNYDDDDSQLADSIQRKVKVKKSKSQLDISASELLNNTDNESKKSSNKKRKIKSEYISEAEEEPPKKKKRRVKSESHFKNDDVDIYDVLRNLKKEFGNSF